MTSKITHLITSLGGGGTENFLYQIISGSPPEFSHEVHYLGKDGVNGDRIRRLAVPVKHVSMPALYKHLTENPPVALHTCLYWAHQVGRVTGRLANVPLIVSSHQSIDTWQKPWHGWIDRLTLPLCDVVDVNSNAAQQVLEKRLANAAKQPRFVKVNNGIDFQALTLKNKSKARDAFKLPLDAIVGGTLMRLHAEKGAENIPEFARALLKENSKLILLIAGTGPMETVLKEQTKEFGDRLRWIGWQEDIATYLSSLDFFWLLSREESFPQALLEASAMGLPWVATNVGGVPELLAAGACGELAPAGKPIQSAAVAKILISQLESRTRRAQEAVPTLRGRYDLANMTKAFYGIIYNSIR